ncbi:MULTISPECIES: DUF397 domain-containing protein [Kitasatospora]|uniref:Uncharacterized protein DUF397 n=1 Tax=Kitasatospora cineracea TaxID=88074 RepID=A0A3N4RXA7_9ACTN|nr:MULTISPECIES: DUF397 domain-containing protein [Kitasatospora]ROR42592.1 uncharacterized protein DUF397 [Kitasatospora cineracea]RPE33087.1 uncharacterized protein DUF397 [Kitasatospora cineracea]WAL73430.1 DUF397 domain-containing protein [Kitasatospora sp. YST-16]WNW39484.1 DUF397 domain-containing protein [Streptomyces sp. Li-HN-5-13]
MSKATESLTWRKSSYSGGNGACVEIAVPGSASIAVRDSKDPQGPQLRFSEAAWAAFAAAAGAGRFGEL